MMTRAKLNTGKFPRYYLRIVSKQWREEGEAVNGTPPEVNEKLTDNRQIRVTIDYPLENPVHRVFTKAGGFTIADFYYAVADAYSEIYADPNSEIWGHGIADLFLEGYGVNDDGSYWLAVGS